MGKTTGNNRLLESFTAYCQAFPEERFWQALRNWWKTYNPDANFILWAESLDDMTGRFTNIVDSFYSEDKTTRNEEDKYL